MYLAGFVLHERLLVALTTDEGLHLLLPRAEISATLAAEVGLAALPAAATTDADAPTEVVTEGVRAEIGAVVALTGVVPTTTRSSK